MMWNKKKIEEWNGFERKGRSRVMGGKGRGEGKGLRWWKLWW